MKQLALLLAPLLALGAPHVKDQSRSIPELNVQEWTSIQSSFVDSVKSLSGWSWNKASSILNDLEEDGAFAGDESQTVWAQLKADPHSFSRLTRLIEFEGTLEKYLDNNDARGTFFAPNNDALKPPEGHGHGHGHHHHHHDHDHDGDHKHHHDHDHKEFDLADFALQEIENTMSLASASAFLESQPAWTLSGDDDDDDDKDKKRKEIFRKIINTVLRYHGFKGVYTAAELAQNSTWPTSLKAQDGSYGGLRRRIKVEKTLIPPSLKINGYAKVYVADQKASNGIFHVINHPLIPPPSIFEEALLFPDFFSTATSAIQQIDARRYLDWTYDHEDSKPGKPKFKGNPLTTFFLPTNTAFSLLPPRLKFFLFSPFGERILAKVLRYHAIPETLLLSEFVYHDEKATPTPWSAEEADKGVMEWFATSDDPSFHKEFDVPTALANATLHIEVDKSKIVPIEGAVKISVKVNGQYVEVIDVPSRNGAFHVIGKVLVPPHKHHDHKGEDIAHLDSWENWEDWLPAWAAEV